jgi:HSP20 family protein
MKNQMIARNGYVPALFDFFARPLDDFGFGADDVFADAMKTDIVDKGDRYQLKADMPGFSKNDIKVSFNDGVLTVSAERHEDKKEDQDGYVMHERSEGRCERQFRFDDVDPQKIYAAYQNGELDICLEKQGGSKGTEISIN